MSQANNCLVTFVHDPIKLHNTSLASKGQVPMPGVIGSQKRHQVALRWDDLGGNSINALLSQKTQPAAGFIPSRVQVNQNRNYFSRRVRVNLAVTSCATATHSDRGRPAR